MNRIAAFGAVFAMACGSLLGGGTVYDFGKMKKLPAEFYPYGDGSELLLTASGTFRNAFSDKSSCAWANKGFRLELGDRFSMKSLKKITIDCGPFPEDFSKVFCVVVDDAGNLYESVVNVDAGTKTFVFPASALQFKYNEKIADRKIPAGSDVSISRILFSGALTKVNAGKKCSFDVRKITVDCEN